jgi:hypothetical protein
MQQKNKISAVLIPANYDEPMQRIELELEYFNPTEWSALKAMYPHIGNGCDTVERVQASGKREIPGADYMFMWVDECGLCKADPVHNERASLIANTRLYGNAILCADSGENSISLPSQMDSPEYIASLDAYVKDQLGGVYVFNPETDRIIG